MGNIIGTELAVLFCTFALSSWASDLDSSGQRLSIRLAKTVQRQGEVVDQVQSWRQYVLHNPRWKQDATMDVLVRVSGSGEERGPEIIAVNAEGLRLSNQGAYTPTFRGYSEGARCSRKP